MGPARDVLHEHDDLAGAVDDLKLLFTVGARAADAAKYPEWRPGNEFRAIREKQLGH